MLRGGAQAPRVIPMKFKAVLFDLDGTLLDTIEDLADSMNIVLTRMGFPAHDVAAYKYHVGDGVRELAVRVLPQDHQDEETIKKCITAMRQEYGSRWDKKTRPYPGIPELLDTLTARGLKMAVLSNKPDQNTKIVVAKLLPKWRFDVVAGERAGIPRKPDPGAALSIAEQLGIAPQAWLYLGDTNTDMKTAVGAGMYPVGALWGFRTRQELMGSGAEVVIENPMQLLALL